MNKQTELTVVETGEPMVPVSGSAGVMSLLERAVDLLNGPNAESAVNALGKLLEYKRQEEDREGIKSFNRAFAQFQRNAPRIVKVKHVSVKGGLKFDYPPLDYIDEKVKPPLNAVGLSYFWSDEPPNKPGNVRQRCHLVHIDGHSKYSDYEGPPDDKAPVSALHRGSGAATTAQRKSLLQVLGLVAMGQDGEEYEQGTGETITIEQANELAELAGQAGIAEARILKYHKIASLTELPVESFETTKQMLAQAAAKKQGGAS